MSWIEEVWPKKKPRQAHDARPVPDGLWDKCAACGKRVFSESFEKSWKVCAHCGHHHRLDAKSRLLQLNQGAYYTLIGEEVKTKDYLNFKDKKPYKQRLVEAQKKSGLSESILCARTKLASTEVVVAIFSFDFIGGSMGSVLGERFVRACEYATKHNLPFVCVTSSGGARMQEGVIALFQMAKTSMAVAKFKLTKNPFITILADPTSGGVAASMAMQADIIIAERGALIGFTGPRVIAQTLREDLPQGFQRADFQLKNGAVDMVVARKDMPKKLTSLLSKLTYKHATEESL